MSTGGLEVLLVAVKQLIYNRYMKNRIVVFISVAHVFIASLALADTPVGQLSGGYPKTKKEEYKPPTTIYVPSRVPERKHDHGGSKRDRNPDVIVIEREPNVVVETDTGTSVVGKTTSRTVVTRPNKPVTGECAYADRTQVAPPNIDLFVVRDNSNAYPAHYQVSGTVEGLCLVEAGYFENGRKVRDIPVKTMREFKRFSFSTFARLDQNPEIRVYNSLGDRETHPIN